MESVIERADDLAMGMIGEYLEHLRRAGRTPATIDGRREILSRLNRNLMYGLGQTTTAELATWLYQERWSQNTRYTYYMAMRGLYRWAVKPAVAWLSFDPTEDLEPVSPAKGRARPCTDEQLHTILTEAAQPFRMWATIAAYQGLRCIEIAQLDREHVSEQQLIVVRGKGGKPRVHDTDPYVWAAVKDQPPGPLARTEYGERATPFHVSSYSAAHFRRIGVQGVSMHNLRHWLGVNLQSRFRDIRVTQAALGHASLSSTQIYTDATDEQQRLARSTLPRLAG